MNIKELNINDYYFHSIIRGANKTFDTIDSVISSRALLSMKLQHKQVINGCHKDNEICLSSVTDEPLNAEEYRSCFDIYVPRLVSLVIDKEVSKKQKIIKPELLSTTEIFNSIGMNNSYTNLYDEYRTIGRIPFKYIKGICIPFDDINNDDIKYLTFLDDDRLIEYYNGLIPLEVMNMYSKRYNNDIDKNKRIDIMDKYVDAIRVLVKQKNVKLPIYYYDSNERKLVLK